MDSKQRKQLEEKVEVLEQALLTDQDIRPRPRKKALWIGGILAAAVCIGALMFFRPQTGIPEETEPVDAATEETFPNEEIYFETLQDALNHLSPTDPVTPRWIPDGFDVDQIVLYSREASRSLHASYLHDGQKENLYISFSESKGDVPSITLERSEGEMELYQMCDQEFYIFQDGNCLVAAWHTGKYDCFISGTISRQDLFRMIGSIFIEETPSLQYSSMELLLEDQGITTLVAPTWTPEGYRLIDATIMFTVSRRFIFGTYENEDGEIISLSVVDYREETPLQIEKDDGPVETYISAGVEYYLFTNGDFLTCSWYVDEFECVLTAPVSREEMIRMIDSIANPFTYHSMQELLQHYGVTAPLAPTMIPEGYALAECDFYDMGIRRQFFTRYVNEEGKDLQISLFDYLENGPILLEKSEGEPRVYTAEGVDYYIFNNYDTLICTYIKDGFECFITAYVSYDEMIEMIDSITAASQMQQMYDSPEEMLADYNVTDPLFPSWLPEGFRLTQCYVDATPVQNSYTAIYNDPDGNQLMVFANDNATEYPMFYEKDDNPIEVYTKDGIDYYIFSDEPDMTCTWRRGDYEAAIAGRVTRDDIIRMIESIGK